MSRIIAEFLRVTIFGALLLSANGALSNCDCGSRNENAPCFGKSIKVDVVGTDRSISLGWEFNSSGLEAACGQFANGDYWLAPRSPGGDVTITAVSSTGSGAVSVDTNPQVESMGLLSSTKTYGNYDESENILNKLPVSFKKDVSLVAAVQRDEKAHGDCGTRAIVGNCVDVYQVVTVLDEVPPNAGANILRPNIDEDVKELLSIYDFELQRIPNKDYLKGVSKEEIEGIRQRWSHSTEVLAAPGKGGEIFSEGGRAFRAHLLVHNYGAGVASRWHNDLMSLFSSENPHEEKLPAIAAMLVYGKDLYFSVYENGVQARGWGSGAGQHLGRFPPAVFFAALAKDEKYKNTLKKVSLEALGKPGQLGPHELEQVNVGPNGPVWGDGIDDMTHYDITGYWDNMLDSQCFAGALGECHDVGGGKASRDPYSLIDGPPVNPGGAYMSVSFGPQQALVAEMFLIPEVCEIVNYQPLILYIDRVLDRGIQTKNDKCAPPDPREDPNTCDAYRTQGCKYFGLDNTGEATWGPKPDNIHECIENGPGQNGRYPERQGKDINLGGYVSTQVVDNWDKIRGNAKNTDCLVSRPRKPDLEVRELH